MLLIFYKTGNKYLESKKRGSFCKKCGHIMQGFTVGNAKLLECGFCGNRIAEMMKGD